MVVFDSQNRWYKSKTGPIETGQLQFKIRLEKNDTIRNVSIILLKIDTQEVVEIAMKKIAEDENSVVYGVTCLFLKPASYEYYFKFTKNNNEYFVRRNYVGFEGYIVSNNKELTTWRLTIFRRITTHPLMKKGIMYQIFPDRFMKGETAGKLPEDRIYRKWGDMPYYGEKIGEDFFGGNFNGISDKIGYLKKLHVSVIYSNPICWSDKNHRYAAIDFKKVDPVLGTEEELIHLVDKLHENGIIYILDAVFNHASSRSIYFDVKGEHGENGAYLNPQSPYREWFHIYGDGKYSCWWNDPSLPKLNYNSDSLNNYIFGEDGVEKYWYRVWKIDGTRQDVADELSNKTKEDIYNIATEERGDNRVVIVEVWEDASCKWAYSTFMEYMQGNQATSVMNYPIRDLLLPYIRYGGDWAHKFKIACNEIFKENYPKEVVNSLMNFISTHDTVRGITKLAGPEVDNHSRAWQAENNVLSKNEYFIGRKRLLLAYTTIFFLPGEPSIYYGDEIGMQGMPDPFCRACFSWDRIDKKLFRAFKRLCAARNKKQDFLAESEFDIVISEERFLLFERTLENKRICVVLNFSETERDITELFRITNLDGVKHYTTVKKPNIFFKTSFKKNSTIFRKMSDGSIRAILPGLEAIVYEI